VASTESGMSEGDASPGPVSSVWERPLALAQPINQAETITLPLAWGSMPPTPTTGQGGAQEGRYLRE